MIPNADLAEKGLLIVTGSTLRAEQGDRPLAYSLRDTIYEQLEERAESCTVVVLSDLWYLNAEALQVMPMISVGGPGVNAVSAHLYQRLPRTLVADHGLMIQMDPGLQDLRVSVWGANHRLTVNAVEIFVQKGYLGRFLEAAVAHLARQERRRG